jgi:predicted TIM-barrel fold metal-dependent hydrolase
LIIDVHCHYTLTCREARVADRFSFEPAATSGGPEFDSFISPRLRRGLVGRLLQGLLGFGWRRRDPQELDRELENWYAQHLLAPGPVDRVVLLAFDAYHDRDGRRPPVPSARSHLGSDMYTSNTLIRELCRRHPDRFLFGASVHPYRPNAIECVDEVFQAGACLLKWIPLHQNIDCQDPRTIRLMQHCARLGLPVLVHYGEEFTLSTQHEQYRPIDPLLEVLRRLRRQGAMPTTIVAHAATPVYPWGDRRPFKSLVSAMLGEFADAPLYADISAMTAWSKTGWLRRLARRQELHGKLLFGTDFPVPPAMPRLRRLIGHRFRDIAAEVSWPHRILRVYRHCGFNEIVFHRAATLLPNVGFFQGQSQPAVV